MSLVTAPTSEPVTLSEVKKWLRVDHDEEDDLLALIIAESRNRVERHTLRHLITQTWNLFLDEWPCGDRIAFPRAPLQSVTSVTYTDSDGAPTVWASTNYVVDPYSEPGYLIRKDGVSWPTVTLADVNAIRIQHVTGYGAVLGHGREHFRSALRLACATLYDHREEIIAGAGVIAVKMPSSFEDILESEIWNKYAPVVTE